MNSITICSVCFFLFRERAGNGVGARTVHKQAFDERFTRKAVRYTRCEIAREREKIFLDPLGSV